MYVAREMVQVVAAWIWVLGRGKKEVMMGKRECWVFLSYLILRWRSFQRGLLYACGGGIW